MLRAVICKLQKVRQYGLQKSIRIVSNRLKIRRFANKHRHAAHAQQAATTWDVFSKTHPAFVLKCDLHFFDELVAHIDQQEIIKRADSYLNNIFLLFDQEIKFEGDARWHTDFLLKEEGGVDCSFDPELYFDDVIISVGKTQKREKDIRVVWELSRLHLLMIIGKAYDLTKEKKYVDYFQSLVRDWHRHNPYLMGVNWVCPMEVAIRAINLIAGYFFVQHADLDQDFKQLYTCLLYDYMRYLEHTWEYYDGRTSNHYLSDLVGYFFLCTIFGKKTDWVVNEILAECDKQIGADGMSYEGSTAYHGLVTELFFLFRLLYKQHGMLPDKFERSFERMCTALEACKINEHEMITIGDNDSGKVLPTGILPLGVKKRGIDLPQERTFFKEFGLTVIQKGGLHVSLRQHAYHRDQPSGHFHNDIGSVTLALNGVPILVDPGSFCYTPSAFWRNYFRSSSIHNLVSVKGRELVDFDDRLFFLAIPESTLNCVDFTNKRAAQSIFSESSRLKFKRSVLVEKNVLKITDIVFESSSELKDIFLFFNFTFEPSISLQKIESGWLISDKHTPLCVFESNIDFDIQFGLMSHNYGSKKPTLRLCSEVLFEDAQEYNCYFRFFNSVL